MPHCAHTFGLCHKSNKCWTSAPEYSWVCTNTDTDTDTNYIQRTDTEADAQAKMLSYLIENKLLSSPTSYIPSR